MRAPIDGAVALVTGASSGIGDAIARQLAPRVRRLILVARRRERLEALAAELTSAHDELEVEVMPCDLTDRDALVELADAIEDRFELDILVNNAGLGDIGMFDLAGWDKTERMIELNVRALTYLTHRIAPGMVRRKKGGILMVSSGFGLSFLPGFAAYVGTKHYVTGFTESLRLELRHLGVVVTQVCPGPVATEFEDVAGNFTGMRPQRFVEISAERCARSALSGFERGRALVLPGVLYRIIMWLGAWTPRWVLRLLYGPGARWFRKRQLDAG
jgi:short-subunit dehydrogenase